MKKIVIILESHIDHLSSAAEVDLVNHLKEQGFNALGLEFPESGTKLEKALENTIKVSKKEYLNPCLQCLLNVHQLKKIDNQPINAKTLMDMEFLPLCELLMQYVSSKKYGELARILLGIRGIQHKLDMIKAYAGSMEIIGIDSKRTSKESDGSCLSDFFHRETGMADSIEDLFRQEKQAVHIIGKSHAEGLVKILTEKGLIEHTVFLDLKSPITFVADQNYLDFVSTNDNVLHPIIVTADAGIESQRDNIDALVDIESTQAKPKKPQI